MRAVRHFIGLVVLGYLLALLVVIILIDRALFQPHPSSYRHSKEIIFIPVAEGEKIAAVWLPDPRATYTILYSHGNGEDLGDILPELQEFHDQGYAVLGYDYRGYGLSGGTASEQNACANIRAAYLFLTVTQQISPERIIVHGYSVGGGPSVDLASRHPVGGLVLESSFTSALRVVTRVPLFPIDRFQNITKLGSVAAPILVIHGTDDRIVPFSHGEALYTAAPRPKRFLRVDRAGHYDLRDVAGERYWAAWRTFIPDCSGTFNEIRRSDPQWSKPR
jgi:abhydrolase domain-containing protein 17